MITGSAFALITYSAVVIGFGYCNHWNLTFCQEKTRFVYIWFEMD